MDVPIVANVTHKAECYGLTLRAHGFIRALYLYPVILKKTLFGDYNEAPPSGKAVQNCVGVRGFEPPTSRTRTVKPRIYSLLFNSRQFKVSIP
jgi:hypothetical protein